jgi:hypothetical protein
MSWNKSSNYNNMHGATINIVLNGCNSNIQNIFECDLIKGEEEAFSN